MPKACTHDGVPRVFAARSETFDIVLVSPRNYFLYTPLLPAVAAGSMEERSIVEPVRSIMNHKVGETHNTHTHSVLAVH